jgi:hypothetical protein
MHEHSTCNRIAKQTDPMKVAQQYRDWAKANLATFAKATLDLIPGASDSRAEDELLAIGFDLLRARQAIRERTR